MTHADLAAALSVGDTIVLNTVTDSDFDGREGAPVVVVWDGSQTFNVWAEHRHQWHNVACHTSDVGGSFPLAVEFALELAADTDTDAEPAA